MGHLTPQATKAPFVSEKNHPHKTPLVWLGIHVSTGRMHSDQTGSVPVPGNHKEQYLFIMFDETSNFIYAAALTDLSAISLRAATEAGLSYFAAHGIEAKILRLDNQVSESVRELLRKQDVTIDITPVGQHRRNKAERAIRTYKNHFIATLAGVDPECPLELWPDFLE